MRTLFFILMLIGGFTIYKNVVNSGIVSEVKETIDAVETTVTEVVDETTEPTPEPVEHSPEVKKYFTSICGYSEFEGAKSVIKWEKDMKIFVMGEKPEYLMAELQNIVAELNGYINPISIKIVNTKSEANFIVYFGTHTGYGNIEPAVRGHLGTNWGMFTIVGGSEINSGNMYVDIYRCESIEGQKHLLREELTQSLGLTNDSYAYSNSIFYQGWTETTSYAPIDVEIIKMLYNE